MQRHIEQEGDVMSDASSGVTDKPPKPAHDPRAMGFHTPHGIAPMFLLEQVLVVIWNGRSEYGNDPPQEMLEELAAIGPMVVAQCSRPVGGQTGRSIVRTSRTIVGLWPNVKYPNPVAGVVLHFARNTATFRSIREECRASGLMAIGRQERYPDWRVSEPGHA
jgi:hypothetical protein